MYDLVDAAVEKMGHVDFTVDYLEFKNDLPNGKPAFLADITINSEAGLN